MRILGIDPGLRTTGFGVIDMEGSELRYVASGTISTQHLDIGELPARLKVLFDGIGEVVQRYEPDHASVEIVFVNVNPQSTLLLGQARGACITALVSRDLPVAEYTALQMKQAVVGYGRADKTQVQSMVQRLLVLPGLPGPSPMPMQVPPWHGSPKPAGWAARLAATTGMGAAAKPAPAPQQRYASLSLGKPIVWVIRICWSSLSPMACVSAPRSNQARTTFARPADAQKSAMFCTIAPAAMDA
jgi:crossover junction endodeoxyribonuclease RuvC